MYAVAGERGRHRPANRPDPMRPEEIEGVVGGGEGIESPRAALVERPGVGVAARLVASRWVVFFAPDDRGSTTGFDEKQLRVVDDRLAVTGRPHVG